MPSTEVGGSAVRLRAGLRRSDAHAAVTIAGITSLACPRPADLGAQIEQPTRQGITKSL